MPRWRRGGHGEGGQVFPLILLAAVGVLFLGAALFQVGRATDYKARAQTGADAAAVAGARALGLELRLGLPELLEGLLPVPALPADVPAPPALGPVPPPPSLDDLLDNVRGTQVRRAAADWAARNDNEVERLRIDLATFSVTVETRTRGTLGGGQPGRARARAQLRVNGFCLPLPAIGDRDGIIPACTTDEQPDLSNLSLRVRLVD